MAEKRRFLDVWILESNTVYREVPYTSVVDWIQQGRLLEDDRLRWSGQRDWFRLGGTPAFVAYLPRPEPGQAGDRAEALEPVQLDFAWRRRPGDEDDDVDMIPLIDVSLVLLIFFIMTATTGAAAFLLTPNAQNYLVKNDPRMYWVGIGYDKKTGKVEYSLGAGDQVAGAKFATQGDLLNELRARLRASPRAKVEINIKAHQDLPGGVVRDLRTALETDDEVGKRVARVYTGVR